MSTPANHRAATAPAMDLVPTPVGTAGITWYRPPGPARAVALLGHGTATGVEAADLQALAAALPGHGISVALVTQPYRMNPTRTGSDEPSLDATWKAVCKHLQWPHLCGFGWLQGCCREAWPHLRFAGSTRLLMA